jgi:hypothetical protein
MPDEILENPIFASKYVSKFTHYSEIDKDIRDNLEMETVKAISYVMLPIVDQIPENKKGIVRVFITNNENQPLTLTVKYSIVGWFSDLRKHDKTKKVETITIQPEEVWFRDISFTSSVKQGKNYFQLLLYDKREVYLTAHFEFSQIREIEEQKQIERSNYLGMLSKPYIDPQSLNYWTFYSLFGPNTYAKEHIIFLFLKIIGALIGIVLIALTIPVTSIFPDYVLPIGIIVTVFSLLAFTSNLDDKHVKFIFELGLTDNPKRGSIKLSSSTISTVLQRYSLSDMNFAYDIEKEEVSWKEGSNKLYQKLVPQIANKLKLPYDIGEEVAVERPVVEEITDKEELKKKIEEGIQLQHEEGIRLRDEVESVGEDSEGVTVKSTAMESTTTVEPDYDSIVTKESVKPDIDPIETKPTMDPLVEAIETQPKMDPKVDPIKTKAEGVVKDAQGYIGKPTDTETIPVPKELPEDLKPLDDKKSAKEIKNDEEKTD